jgi:hypothetical protein
VELAPNAADSNRRIEVVLRIDKRFQNLIREDSSTTLTTESLLGGRVVNIRRGFLSYNCDLTPMVDRERRRQEVQIENNSDRNLRDLEEMLRSAKTLKRNIRECNEILIGPRFFAYGTVLSFRDDLGIRPDVVSRSEVRTWEGTHMNRTF